MNATNPVTSQELVLSAHLPDGEATEQLGAWLAKRCTAGDCIALTGELGAGKTSFARGFIKALTDEEEIISPTFMLLQSYKAKNGMVISHFDLYRLNHGHEAVELGLADALTQGVTLIEWPQLVMHELPAHTLSITLAHEGEGRLLQMHGAPLWHARLEEFK
jgi:tRNA threonylcarbamoyl adenosine modification protein YjeE